MAILEQVPTDTKPAVQSWTIWGGAIVLATQILSVFPDIVTTIAPIISPHAVVVVTALGGLLTIFGRVFGTNKPISGLVNQR